MLPFRKTRFSASPGKRVIGLKKKEVHHLLHGCSNLLNQHGLKEPDEASNLTLPLTPREPHGSIMALDLHFLLSEKKIVLSASQGP